MGTYFLVRNIIGSGQAENGQECEKKQGSPREFHFEIQVRRGRTSLKRLAFNETRMEDHQIALRILDKARSTLRAWQGTKVRFAIG